MPMTPSDSTLSGKKIRVWAGGSGDALLLIHSAWGDAEMSWEGVWNDLSGSFAVIAPDLPGFGASERLDRPSLEANALILKELLDLRRIDRAVVAGNSFGAAVAIEFASLFPERARRLVVVNGGYLPVVPGFVMKALSLPFIEKRFRSLMQNIAYTDNAFAKAFPHPDKLPQGFFPRIRGNQETQARVVYETFRGQARPQTRSSVPSTMIWGTGDRLVTMKQAGIIRKWLGDADFAAIDGAGHMPQVEQPKAFVEAVKRAARA
ncbi:MAG: alpha/beta fold hydrolase [Nitrospirota bacterium]